MPTVPDYQVSAGIISSGAMPVAVQGGMPSPEPNLSKFLKQRQLRRGLAPMRGTIVSISQGHRDGVRIDARQRGLCAGDAAVDGEVLQQAVAGAGLGIGTDGRAPVVGAAGIAVQRVIQVAAKGARQFAAGASAGIQADGVRGAVGAEHGDVAGLIHLRRRVERISSIGMRCVHPRKGAGKEHNAASALSRMNPEGAACLGELLRDESGSRRPVLTAMVEPTTVQEASTVAVTTWVAVAAMAGAPETSRQAARAAQRALFFLGGKHD